MQVTGGELTLEGQTPDGTFQICQDKVSETVVGTLARAEALRERIPVNVLESLERVRCDDICWGCFVHA